MLDGKSLKRLNEEPWALTILPFFKPARDDGQEALGCLAGKASKAHIRKRGDGESVYKLVSNDLLLAFPFARSKENS